MGNRLQGHNLAVIISLMNLSSSTLLLVFLCVVVVLTSRVGLGLSPLLVRAEGDDTVLGMFTVYVSRVYRERMGEG